jgi:hypothetical protein
MADALGELLVGVDVGIWRAPCSEGEGFEVDPALRHAGALELVREASGPHR